MNGAVRYQVVPARQWRHANGEVASLYGAVPWTNEVEKANWNVVECGWTVFNPRNGTYGIGRVPWQDRADAEAFAANHAPPAFSMGD